MMEKFLRYVSPKEAEECNQDDLIRIINEYIIPEGLKERNNFALVTPQPHICWRQEQI
jgi:hypothetical protein